MKPGYNANRLWFGGWVLIGLSVVGINGHYLLSLLDEPLSGYSHEVRRVDQGLRQLRRVTFAETEMIGSGMKQLTERFAHPQGVVIAKPNRNAGPTAQKKVTVLPVPLPELTGLFTHRSTDGTVCRYAFLDGTVCAAGDKVGSLMVEEVTDQGVRLAKGRKKWFVKAPENNYSLTVQ